MIHKSSLLHLANMGGLVAILLRFHCDQERITLANTRVGGMLKFVVACPGLWLVIGFVVEYEFCVCV